VEEPQDDHPAVELGQRRDQLREDQEIFWFLPGAGGSHQVTETACGVVADWAVQGQFLAALGDRQRLQHLLLGHPQTVGQLGDGG